MELRRIWRRWHEFDEARAAAADLPPAQRTAAFAAAEKRRTDTWDPILRLASFDPEKTCARSDQARATLDQLANSATTHGGR